MEMYQYLKSYVTFKAFYSINQEHLSSLSKIIGIYIITILLYLKM